MNMQYGSIKEKMNWERTKDNYWENEEYIIKREDGIYGWQYYFYRKSDGVQLDSCQTLENMKKKVELYDNYVKGQNDKN